MESLWQLSPLPTLVLFAGPSSSHKRSLVSWPVP